MATLGNVIPGYNDWFISTGPTLFSGPDSIINELTMINYSLSYFLDRDASKMLQGGSKIMDTVYLDGDYEFGSYWPGKKETFNATNVLTNHEVTWRFERGKMSWTEAEVDLQGPSSSSGEVRYHTFKRIRATKKENMMTGVANGIEARIWAQPDYEGMELAGVSVVDAKHYSLPCIANEFTAALHNVTADGLYPGWSTFQQIAPALHPNWDNKRFTYASAGLVKSTHNSQPNDIFRAFSKAKRQTKAKALPRGGTFEAAFQAPSMICCSDWGIGIVEATFEAGNERYRTRSRNDGDYDGVEFRGIPFEYFESLDEAALYPDDDTGDTLADDLPGLTTEALAGKAGPRFSMFNMPFVKPFFHVDHFFKMKDPYFLPEQPDVWVSLLDLWSNIFCRSRRRHAHISPSEDQTALIPA
jgi:hypothetical protein